MADNFGPEQPTVRVASDKGWDQIVFQAKKPPLSSEWNLVNQVASLKAQQSVSSRQPSGWVHAGRIFNTSDVISARENANPGDVITSDQYLPNTFNLVGKGGQNLAVVNGWVLDVSRTNNTAEDNIITLMEPPTSGRRTDFVFLEVWKELVGSDDIVYPNGNTLSDSALQNDLIDPVAGFETTKRVQLKYRIRVHSGTGNGGFTLSANPQGFGNEVVALGGNPEGAYTVRNFINQAGNGDPGLWRAGNGTVQDQELLNSVDGYVYAIPMFAVDRRTWGAYTAADSYKSLVYKSSSKVSDRPDLKKLDEIVDTDFVDLRNKIMLAGESLESYTRKTWRSLISGSLGTSKGQVSNGSGYLDAPGGNLVMKAEEIGNGSSLTPLIGTYDSVGFKRRAYCNSGSMVHRNNIVVLLHAGAWSEGEVASVQVIDGQPASLLAQAVNGVYSPSLNETYEMGTDVVIVEPDLSGETSIQVSVPAGSSLIGKSTDLYLQISVEYLSGNNGFLDVPESMLEVQDNNTSASIATSDADVPMHGADAAVEDYVRYNGGEYTANWEFGNDLVLFRTLATSTSIALSFADGKYFGNTVLGVKSVQRKKSSFSVGEDPWGTHQAFSFTRSVAPSATDFVIDGITSVDDVSDEVRITLYTNAKSFRTNKQGRGVIDIYEMIEVPAVETSPGFSGVFEVDTGIKPIIALATRTQQAGSGSSITATAWAYVDGRMTPFSSGSPIKNTILPVLQESDYTDGKIYPTKLEIDLSDLNGSEAPGSTISVVLLVHSYIEPSDSYVFYYATRGFQGYTPLSPMNGSILGEGPAVVTTAGSGAVSNETFGTRLDGSTATFSNGSHTVSVNGETVSFDRMAAGDYIYRDTVPLTEGRVFDVGLRRYKIVSWDSVASTITLVEPFCESSTGTTPDSYIIERDDTPADNVSNIIDRMPALLREDFKGASGSVDAEAEELAGLSFCEPSCLARRQDPLDSAALDVSVGVSGAYRGRKTLLLTTTGNPIFKLKNPTASVFYGPRVTDSYCKVFQSYLFNDEETGKLLLLVVSGETYKESPVKRLSDVSLDDTVAVYELIGRPLIKNG